MNTHELVHEDEKGLRNKANKALAMFETAGGNDKAHLLLQAQFYMRELEHRREKELHELERRHDKKWIWIGFISELVIIALVIAQILITTQ